MYADVDVIVNGALEEAETFFDQTLLDHYVATITDEAQGHGYRTEIFVQYHDHDLMDEECVCAQFEQDHHPTVVVDRGVVVV